jgi:hypothetical protein
MKQQAKGSIPKENVGVIAERIVANELEYRGFRVSDLNRDRVAANADLLAATGGRVWQIRVKGASVTTNWWVHYGNCSPAVVSGKEPMFNRRAGFYRADIVVLVSLRSLEEYKCIVLPTKTAERAVQMNLDRGWRRRGQTRKPFLVVIGLDGPTKPRRGQHPLQRELKRVRSLNAERWLLLRHEGRWDLMS